MEYLSQSELILNLILSSALFGIIWMVQLVVYPGFRNIPAEDWKANHSAYTNGIAWIVGPLMLAELALAVVLVLRSGVEGDWFLPLMIVLSIWLSTFFIQIPQHNKLREEKDDIVVIKLVGSNWIRTMLWTFKLVYTSFLVYDALL